MTSEAAPAATVVLVRDARDAVEVLLLRRSSKLAFHGGAWVFPGGRIDAADAGADGDAGAARRAAAREAREEAGLELDPDALAQISHWTTPEGMPKRFATWFFLGHGDATPVRVDGGEIHAHRWMTPTEALAARRSGEIELPPPTFVTLTTLAAVKSADEAVARARAAPPLVYLPRFIPVDDGAISLYPEDAGWEVRDPGRPGARHRLLMLKAGWEYLRSS